MNSSCIARALAAASFTLASLSAHAAWFITDLGTLGGTHSQAFGINNAGQIVGEMGFDQTSGATAFLYQNGTVTNLGHLPGGEKVIGGIYSSAYGINSQGQAVGSSVNLPGFLFSGGNMSSLGTLGGNSSRAFGINDYGQIVGDSATVGYNGNRAFLHSNGTMKDLGTLGGDSSRAVGINNNGVIAGTSSLASGYAHAFSYSNGKMNDLGTLGGNNSEALAINHAGQIVGTSTTAANISQAFLFSGGKMTDIGSVLGGDYSEARGINNQGQVVGIVSYANAIDAFLYAAGTFITLNKLPEVQLAGWTDLQPNAINDRGDIVGRGTINGELHAFVLSSNQLFAAPTIFKSIAPEIDGGNAILGIALLGGFLAFRKREKREAA